MLVLLDVRAVVEVPDDTKLTPYAMALQDSKTILFETLTQAGYEVIVHSAPPRHPADIAAEQSDPGELPCGASKQSLMVDP